MIYALASLPACVAQPHFPWWARSVCPAAPHRSYSLNYVATLSAVLLITWPKEGFLNLRDLPFTYNALGGTTLIILAYLSVSRGPHLPRLTV